MARFPLCLLLPAALCLPAWSAERRQYDVVIVGATASGVGAAIAAGREGLRVALTEETPSVGGMITNGVSQTNLRALGGSNGIFEEFRRRVQRYYQQTIPDDPIIRQTPSGDSHFFPLNRPWGSLGLVYEPKVAEMVLRQMLREIPNIDVIHHVYPVRVLRSGRRIRGVVVRSTKDGSELTLEARVTMDATHEGDLLPLAGVRYRLGREPRTPEEPHAGRIYMTWDGHYFGSGEGDDRLQAFTLFAIARDYGPGADRTIPKPPGYDPSRFNPVKELRPNLPNNKIIIAVEIEGFSNQYVLGNREERKRIYEIFRQRLLSWLYYIQTECGLKRIGLADDEFPENGNVAWMLYVREGRRLEGAYVYNERDCTRMPGFRRPPLMLDSIAVVDWESDSHQIGEDFEGYVHWAPDSRDPYRMYTPSQIPYWVMVPKEVDGFLVPMAVSATHIGFGVLRIDPSRVNMGQAAGVAAAMAIRQGVELRQISVAELQERLLDQGQTLFFYTDVYPSHPFFRSIQRLSMAGVTEGWDDYSFRPDAAATRADAAELVFHGLGLRVKMDYWSRDFFLMRHWHPASTPDRPGHWSSYYLMTLYKLGAIDAQSAATLRVGDRTTRAELAHWIATALALPPARDQAYFPDVPAGHRFFASVNALARAGLLPGAEPGAAFRPDEPISRGEACHWIDFIRQKKGIRRPAASRPYHHAFPMKPARAGR
jgi:hypothetical protein